MKTYFRFTWILTVCLVLLSCAAKTEKTLKNEQISDRERTKNIQQNILEKFRNKQQIFNSCFESENRNSKKNKYPPLKKLISLVTLESDGGIRATDIIAIQPVSKEFKKCMSSVISSIEFDPIGFNEPVLIFYPLEYKKSN